LVIEWFAIADISFEVIQGHRWPRSSMKSWRRARHVPINV